MTRRSRRRRLDAGNRAILQSIVEGLEPRRLLCEDGHEFTAPVEIGGDAGAVVEHAHDASADAGPATIVWSNRGTMSSDTDRFNSVFGANADVARGVVDAVIASYSRMITSFNYSDGSNTYTMNLSMASSGTSAGASAGLSTTLGGKPRSGSITMGRGSDTTGDGLGDGGNWFIDPTPMENSEFQGNIVNAFSADAQAGSPASGKGDFFTVVAAEMTHLMGLYGGTGLVPLWDAHTTNTGIADTAEGGGVGKFWVFQGPSIKHLMTGNNGGGGGNSFNGAVHASGPNVTVNFGGDSYVGSQDQGNAIYEFSRRYMINNAFALMFKDAYSYTTVNPDQFGTMYSNLNTTSHNLLVRGSSSASNSNDVITISQSGSTLSVAVDIGLEVGGIGALPGTGDLPAFVSQYDISQVTSITIQGLSGDDTINLDNISAGLGLTISGGNGNDTINIGGSDLAGVQSSATINGDAGIDTINVLDGSSGGLETYTISSNAFSRTGAPTFSYASTSEKLVLVANASNNTINVNSTATNIPVTIDAGAGADLINIASTAANAPVTIISTAGLDTVNVNGGSAIFPASAQLSALSVGAGGLVTLPSSGANVLSTQVLSLTGSAAIDITNNGMIVDYTGQSPLGDVAAPGSIANSIATAHNGGLWTGAGIRSATAAAAGVNFGVGYGEATDTFDSFPATFMSQGVDDTSVLIRYTLRGDANLDHIVDTLDFGMLSANFSKSPRSFAEGDFNYDGLVDTGDFNLLASNFSNVLPAEPASAPARSAAPPAGAPPLFGTSVIAPARNSALVLESEPPEEFILV